MSVCNRSRKEHATHFFKTQTAVVVHCKHNIILYLSDVRNNTVYYCKVLNNVITRLKSASKTAQHGNTQCSQTMEYTVILTPHYHPNYIMSRLPAHKTDQKTIQ